MYFYVNFYLKNIPLNFLKYILLFFFIALSCEKEELSPGNKGSATISSELFTTGLTYYVFGFSFEADDFARYPGTDKMVDFFPVNEKNAAGEVTGVYFDKTGTTQNGFHKNGDFQDLNSVQEYYDNYMDPVQGPLVSLTGNISPFQVYTFKTTKDNYVKFLVKDVRSIEDVSENTDHVEVDISYYIQRDGSLVFEE